MRRLSWIAVLVLLIGVSGQSFGDWTLKQVGGLTEPTILYKVWAVDPQNSYLIGRGFDGLFDLFNEHLIYRSTNGGDTLEPLLTKNINPFAGGICNSFYGSNDLYFEDLWTGVVVGTWHGGHTNCLLIDEYNWISKTSNAGADWTDSNTSPAYENKQLNAMDILPDGFGIAVGDATNIWKTTNHGQTWTAAANAPSVWGTQAPLQSVDVVTDSLIYATAETYWDEAIDDDFDEDEDFSGELSGIKGELLRSTDGGASWQSLRSDANLGYHRVHFVDASHGWLIVANDNAEISQILYTTDGATTWNAGLLPTISGIGSPGTDYLIADIQMMDTQNGWAVGGDDAGFDTVILKTTNGGVSWQADPYRGAGQLLDVNMLSERFGLAVGTRKVVVGYYVPGEEDPIADAGPDRTMMVGSLVELDGSDSYDPDGDPLTYAWSQTAGPSVTLSNPTLVNPSFTAGTPGDYTFRLIVSDYDTSSAPDSVTIHVTDESDDDMDDDTDDDTDDDSDDDSDDDADDDFHGDDDGSTDDDTGSDDTDYDCRDLLSSIYDDCDAYLPAYDTRFDAEAVCDETSSPWDCAVNCGAEHADCDGLFECLTETCNMDVKRNGGEKDESGGNLSGGCSVF